MMEKRHQNLAKLIQKNDTWSWLGENSFLGDKTISQYSGLKIFIRYVIENRVSILDNREDRGVDFVSSGDNPLCRSFIKYLQQKSEAEQDEKKKEQYAWMGNRAEAMIQMKDPSLGQMNDGIFLAHAFTFFKLGEDAKPRIEVGENSITGLLEDGFSKCRKGDSNLGRSIDKIENRDTPTLTPAEAEPVAPASAPAPKATPGTGGGGGVAGAGGGGAPSSYTKREFGKTAIPGKPKEKGKEPTKPQDKEASAIPGEDTEEPIVSGEPGMSGVPLEGGGFEELLPAAFAGATGGKTTAPGSAGKGKAAVAGKGKKGYQKSPKLKVVSSGGKRKRKKQTGPQKGVEKDKQRPQTAQLPLPAQGAPVPPGRPAKSGGWKIAKKAMKYTGYSSAGAGGIWAAASEPEAAAKVFAFINLFF